MRKDCLLNLQKTWPEPKAKRTQSRRSHSRARALQLLLLLLLHGQRCVCVLCAKCVCQCCTVVLGSARANCQTIAHNRQMAMSPTTAEQATSCSKRQSERATRSDWERESTRTMSGTVKVKVFLCWLTAYCEQPPSPLPILNPTAQPPTYRPLERSPISLIIIPTSTLATLSFMSSMRMTEKAIRGILAFVMLPTQCAQLAGSAYW